MALYSSINGRRIPPAHALYTLPLLQVCTDMVVSDINQPDVTMDVTVDVTVNETVDKAAEKFGQYIIAYT